jgi:hypothetical protein
MGSLKRGSSFKKRQCDHDDDAFSDEAAASFEQSKEATLSALPADSACCGGVIVSERWATSSRTVGHSPGFRISSVHGLQSLYVSIRREEGRR